MWDLPASYIYGTYLVHMGTRSHSCSHSCSYTARAAPGRDHPSVQKAATAARPAVLAFKPQTAQLPMTARSRACRRGSAWPAHTRVCIKRVLQTRTRCGEPQGAC